MAGNTAAHSILSGDFAVSKSESRTQRAGFAQRMCEIGSNEPP